MDQLFAPAWEDSPCIYCNSPVGSDGETDDGEFYSCAACRDAIERERERVTRMYETRTALYQYDVSSGHGSPTFDAADYY
jgi:hypothetical protein